MKEQINFCSFCLEIIRRGYISSDKNLGGIIMKDITVYTSTTCSFCHMVKDYLDSKGLKYTEKNIAEDKEARMEMMKMGFTGVPVVIIGDEKILGYDKAKIDAALED